MAKDKKPKAVCNCSYPKVKMRNQTGHATTCPVHAERLAELKKKESK